LYDNEWLTLIAVDPNDGTYHQYLPKQGWTRPTRMVYSMNSDA
jgi:hypothetical protein